MLFPQENEVPSKLDSSMNDVLGVENQTDSDVLFEDSSPLISNTAPI